MMGKEEFVALAAERCRRRAAGRTSAAVAADEDVPAEVDASTFLKSLGSPEELVPMITDLSRTAGLEVKPDEARHFLLAAPRYNVADLYEFLAARREERREARAFLLYKAAIVLCALAAVYALFQVQIVWAFLASAAGSGMYGYLFLRKKD